MNDVAARAGVSQATVSRVLNAPVGTAIAPATRARVLLAMEELAYRPHLGAQTMKNRRSRQVGVLVENSPQRPFTHPLTWEFILGINDGLEAGGHIMSLVRLTDLASPGEGLGARALRSQLLDGLIVVNHLPPEVEARVEELFPCTVWLDGNVWHPANCVRRDEAGAAQTAVREIARLRYQKLIYLGPNLRFAGHYSFAERERGARMATRSLGLRATFETIEPHHSPASAFVSLLPRLAPEVALLVPGAYDAMQIVFECAWRGLAVGRDFALACCDDGFHDGAAPFAPVARVEFDRFALGRQSAEMLLQTLSGDDAPPSRLIAGAWRDGATCPARGAAP